MNEMKNYLPYIRKALQDAPNKVDPPTDGALRHKGLDTSKIHAMGLNESFFPPSPNAIQAMRDNLNTVNLYPDAQCPHLTDIIAERTGVARNCIVWGNGSEELLKGSIDLSLSPGDGLVLPVPTFWGYKAMVAAFEANVAEIPNLLDGKIDIDGVHAAIDRNTKIVFLITPNNPSGSMIEKDELERAINGVPDDVLLCVDEAYYDYGIYAGGPDVLSVLKKREGPWITVFTFSKAYAMAGMRIGYALCSSNEIAQALQKTTCVFNVPLLAQYAARESLLDKKHLNFILQETKTGREQLYSGLCNLGLEPLKSVTNFVSTKLPANGRDVMREMLKNGVQINAWADFGYENFIRITVNREESNSKCLATLEKVLNSI